MQCGCPNCGTFMGKAEHGLDSYCVCSNCGHICKDCMGGEKRFPEKIEKGGKIPLDILLRYGELK